MKKSAPAVGRSAKPSRTADNHNDFADHPDKSPISIESGPLLSLGFAGLLGRGEDLTILSGETGFRHTLNAKTVDDKDIARLRVLFQFGLGHEYAL